MALSAEQCWQLCGTSIDLLSKHRKVFTRQLWLQRRWKHCLHTCVSVTVSYLFQRNLRMTGGIHTRDHSCEAETTHQAVVMKCMQGNRDESIDRTLRNASYFKLFLHNSYLQVTGFAPGFLKCIHTCMRSFLWSQTMWTIATTGHCQIICIFCRAQSLAMALPLQGCDDSCWILTRPLQAMAAIQSSLFIHIICTVCYYNNNYYFLHRIFRVNGHLWTLAPSS